MTDLLTPLKLNPAQQQVTDELGARPTERPSFRDDLRDHLRHELTTALEPVVTGLDESTSVMVSKRTLQLLHGCEARYLAEQRTPFTWTVPIARGTVVHKAIELLVAWRGEPTPLELVEHAMARLEHEERGVGPFLQSLDDAERAELVGLANDQVATFLETFPPLNRRWVPVAESRVRADLCHDRVALVGKVDLSLGRAQGSVAGKVLIDLKTGRPLDAHAEDLRFYALLETLKVGVPPRLLVDYYLEAGQPRRQEVTEDLLWATARRVIDGVTKLVALTGPAAGAAELAPGSGCRWCPAVDHCDPGKQYLTSEIDGWPDP
jgi:hypothetical protein